MPDLDWPPKAATRPAPGSRAARLGAALELFSAFALRRMRAQPFRTLAAVAAIALGSAVFLAVRLAVSAALVSFSGSMDALVGQAQAVAQAPSGRLPDPVWAFIESRPYVAASTPLLTIQAQIDAKPGESLRLIGLDPLSERAFHPSAARPAGSPDLTRAMAELMARPDTLVLAPRTAERLGLQPGGTLSLSAAGRTRPFTVLALLNDQGLAQVDAGRTAAADIATAQEFVGAQGLVDRVDVIFTPDTPPDQGRARLQADLDQRFGHIRVAGPGEQRESAAALIDSYRLNLSVLSLVSLFTGLFLVYALTSLEAASRRRELAVLRSLGASPGLVRGLFLGMGTCYALAGWLVGLPLAWLLGKAMLSGVAFTVDALFVRVAVEQASFSTREALYSLLLTLAAGLVATLGPSRQALAANAAFAMRRHLPTRARGPGPGLLSLWGLVLILGSTALALAPAPDDLPVWGYAASFGLFAGFSSLAPAATLGLAALARRLLAPLLARPALLGADLALSEMPRSGTRNAVSVGALVTAVALFTALAVMIGSFRATFTAWLEETVAGDVFIRPALAEQNGYLDPLPDDLVDWLAARQARGDAVVVPYDRAFFTTNGRPYQIEALDIPTFARFGSFRFVEALPGVMEGLARGQGAVIGEVTAAKLKLGLGDRLAIPLPSGEANLPVLGIVRSFRTRGGDIFLDLRAWRFFSGSDRIAGVRVFFPLEDPEKDDAQTRFLADLAQKTNNGAGLEIYEGSALRALVTATFDKTFAITTVLLAIALLTATLGLSCALVVGVLERGRELATLRALGSSKRQVALMLATEAATLAASGLVLGLACGLTLALVLIYVVNRQSFGWTFDLLLPWTQIALTLPLTLAAIGLSLPPALAVALEKRLAARVRE